MKRWVIWTIALAVIAVTAGALALVMYQQHRHNAADAPRLDLAPPALPPVSNIQLSAWIYSGSVPAAAWERVVAEFQKTTGLGVKLTVHDSEEAYRRALREAMLTHTLPDVFLIDSQDAEAWRKAGQLALIDVTPADTIEWLPGALAPFLRGPKTVAFPSDFTLLALFYNRSAFDRVGIAYPDVHWTWETMLGISQAIYRPPDVKGGDPVFAMELPWNSDLWHAFSCQAGAGLYTGATWQVGDPKTAPAQIKALTFLRDYIKRYVIVARPLSAKSGGEFLRGRASMVIAGSDLLRDLRGRKDLRWSVAPLPRDAQRATVLQSRGWAVSGFSPHPSEAARLARALASQPSRTDWLPAKVDSLSSVRSDEEAVFYESARVAQPPLALATAPEMKKLLDDEMLRWIHQPEPSPEALIEWAKKMFPQ